MVEKLVIIMPKVMSENVSKRHITEVHFHKKIKDTGKAWLIQLKPGEKAKWVPRGAFRLGSDDHTIWVYTRWLKKEGWI